MIDGSALLWRLELDNAYGEHGAGGEASGLDDPSAWRTLADLAARVSRPGFVFGEIHAALAYARCGDEAALTKLIDGLRELHAKGHPIAGTVALPLVQGIAAFVAGDHAGALAQLEPVEGEIHRVGGSHAQWELFEETMAACYLRLERHDGRPPHAPAPPAPRIATRPSVARPGANARRRSFRSVLTTVST